MGVDIHMYVINKDGEYVCEDIYDGRNTEWFNNLQNHGCYEDVYSELPSHYGIPELVPMNMREAFEKQNEWGYYGFFYMTVEDFKKWFSKYRPDVDAGWVSTYDKWKYETKGWYPENISHYLDKEDNINDYHFIEVVNKYDCSAWLFNYLNYNGIDNDNLIVYWFDC